MATVSALKPFPSGVTITIRCDESKLYVVRASPVCLTLPVLCRSALLSAVSLPVASTWFSRPSACLVT